MFNLIEEKTVSITKNHNQKNGIHSTSIVSDSIEMSVFGKFSKNYKLYRDLPEKKESVEIMKTYFINSSILDDV